MTFKSETNGKHNWQAEATELLKQPFVASHGMNREGRTLAVRIMPYQSMDDKLIDLSVTLLPLHLSPPAEDEREADRAALAVFLEGLKERNHHLRAASCQALGQLGDQSALAALEAACGDENRHVRAAASQALVILGAPRVRPAELVGLRLALWQQVRHLWSPLGTAVTDRHGQAWFARVPGEASCHLGLQAAKSVSVELAAQYGQALAAKSTRRHPPLPPPQSLAVGDGELLWTFYRDSQQQLVIEFRSSSLQLRDGWVHFRAIDSQNSEQVLSEFLKLEPDVQGILTGKFVLAGKLDLQRAYRIECEPFPI